jgi:hypothetical protein
MEAQHAIKRSRWTQVISLLLYFFICGLLASPVAMIGGDACGRYKLILVFLIFCRLAWQIYKRTFRFRDYFIYFAVTVVFCFWADCELEHTMLSR